jgi:transcriptional regulator with XRE-family HTH domain
MTKKEFGNWLKLTRVALSISQDQLAKKLGFSEKEIAKFEAGVAEFPKSKIQALALHLKVDKKFELQLRVIFHDGDKEKKKLA